MSQSAFDPLDLPRVASGLLEFLSSRVDAPAFAEPPAPIGNGIDTYVYAFSLAGKPGAPWDRPLILRIYPSAEQGAKAQREVDVQDFLANAGFPVPRPLALALRDSPFGLPFMVMERIPGTPALDRLKNPFAIPGIVRSLATLQARLHTVPLDGCPLPSSPPLIERMLAETRLEVDKHELPGANEMLAWAESKQHLVAVEEPSLCHNDFHPLNVVVDGDDASVVDWSDAALGDRHCDLARTLALFWLAPPLARSVLERTVLRLIRGYIVRTYRRAYELTLPVDDTRLRYWQAVHVLRVIVQLQMLERGRAAELGTQAQAATATLRGISPSLSAYFEERAAGL